MKNLRMHTNKILEDCLELIQQRGGEYGDCCFGATADLFLHLRNIKLEDSDIALILFCLKVARLAYQLNSGGEIASDDTLKDMINYIALYSGLEKCHQEEKN